MIPYAFTKHAEAEFLTLPRDIQHRILRKIEQYLRSPDPLRTAQRITGASRPCFRYRIGDYRVIFDWEGHGILITRVGHRREIYR